MEPSKYCDSKNEEKLFSYRTEGFFNIKILPSATAQYHSTYWRTVIPDSTWDSIIFPIPGTRYQVAVCTQESGIRSTYHTGSLVGGQSLSCHQNQNQNESWDILVLVVTKINPYHGPPFLPNGL
jgi:hypothetical protein